MVVESISDDFRLFATEIEFYHFPGLGCQINNRSIDSLSLSAGDVVLLWSGKLTDIVSVSNPRTGESLPPPPETGSVYRDSWAWKAPFHGHVTFNTFNG